MALNIDVTEAQGESYRRRLLDLISNSESIQNQMNNLKANALALRAEINAHVDATPADVQAVTDLLTSMRADLITTANNL